jgi:hypothetical protein
MPTFHQTATRATHIRQETPDTNYGSNVIMRLHRRPGRVPAQNKESRILLHFDIQPVPNNAIVTDAKLFLDFEQSKSAIYVRPVAQLPPQAEADMIARGYTLRYLTQHFTQNGATWNRWHHSYAAVRTLASSSTSGAYVSSSSWSYDHMHQWPGGAGAMGDTIDDGEVVGTLPTTTGTRIIDITALAVYAHENASGMLRLLLSCATNVDGGLWKIAGINDPASSSQSSTALVEPKVEIRWTKGGVSSGHGATSSSSG